MGSDVKKNNSFYRINSGLFHPLFLINNYLNPYICVLILKTWKKFSTIHKLPFLLKVILS